MIESRLLCGLFVMTVTFSSVRSPQPMTQFQVARTQKNDGDLFTVTRKWKRKSFFTT